MSKALTVYSNVHPIVRADVAEYNKAVRFRVSLMVGFVLSWVVTLAALYGTFGTVIQGITLVLTLIQAMTLVMLHRLGLLIVGLRFWREVFFGRW